MFSPSNSKYDTRNRKKQNNDATSRTCRLLAGGTTAFVLVEVQRVPKTSPAHVRAPVHVDIRAGIDSQKRRGRIVRALAHGRPADGVEAGRRYPVERWCNVPIRTRRPAGIQALVSYPERANDVHMSTTVGTNSMSASESSTFTYTFRSA